MEGMGDFQFVFNVLKTVDQRIHIVLFPTSFALPADCIEDLALAQGFENEGFLDVDVFEVEQKLVVPFRHFQSRAFGHDKVLELL